jgi:circadian clock protein KaiB
MDPQAAFRFKLFVAGNTTNSRQALGNLTALCRELLDGRHDIEVVDILKEPQEAFNEGIFMTPTLIKLAPLPPGRIVGTLTDARLVAQALGLGLEADQP